MKKAMLFFAVIALFGVSLARATMLEDWTDESGSNTGSFQDTAGSKMVISTDVGPQAGQTSLKLSYTLASGNGFCGIWHNMANDFSKSGSLKFMVKATTACKMGVALKDTYNVQYISNFQAGTSWAQVVVPFASFVKDPYYTPSDAVTGHAMDLSHTTSMNFQASAAGTNILWIGPIELSQDAQASTGAATISPSTGAAASNGSAVVVQDFSNFDDKSAGSFQDSQGSSFTYKAIDNTNKPGSKFLVVSYNLVSGGNCGMWCRAGSDWSGIDLSSAKTLNLMVYTKAPIVIGLALKDKNNNQYVALTPMSKGGVWETLSVPLDSFILDPYFTPPDAIKGAPKDFSKLGTFNLQAKTEGKFGFAVASVTAQ